MAFVVGGVCLRMFLSRRESGWTGLVLPGLCVLYALLMVLNVAGFGDAPSAVVATVMVLLMRSIPALILLALYAACRGGRKKRGEMEKMKLYDL